MLGIVLLPRIIGVLHLIVIGLIHLIILRAGFHLQTYLGILFVIGAVAAFVGAVWIGLFDARLGWLLGLLAALGPLLGYIVTRTIALPGLHVLPWNTPNGLLSLVLEAIIVILALFVLGRRLITRAVTTL